MATKKVEKKAGRIATFVACNPKDNTYQLFESVTLADVEKELKAKRSNVLGKSPDYQVFEVPRKIFNLFAG